MRFKDALTGADLPDVLLNIKHSTFTHAMHGLVRQLVIFSDSVRVDVYRETSPNVLCTFVRFFTQKITKIEGGIL